MKTYLIEATVFVCSILACVQTETDWSPNTFCSDYSFMCPAFKSISKNIKEDYVERFYDESRWLKTDIEGSSPTTAAIVAAYNKLDEYIGETTQDKTKPVAVLYSANKTRGTYSLCFYEPNVIDKTDPSIEEYIMPAGTMIVRVFSGVPSVTNFIEQVEKLQKDLKSADRQYDHNKYMVVAYERPLQLFYRHDEAWIPAV
ncbi:hypothetical protein COCON_G00221890 [Conger conger]|uniref:Heme-binding protein 2 n=1 Tax=Conger conger TaxID=82655 RepID=A0A9Q1CWP1_CONCO|nr:hypothetical protein COCON_G00221890 [Conger conger]